MANRLAGIFPSTVFDLKWLVFYPYVFFFHWFLGSSTGFRASLQMSVPGLWGLHQPESYGK